ncbi:MAG: PadR family transcriptional regulator [Gemmatimonadetes bacterium]|nr:PadR family transcriptional regulator [Gemmatimonadota bacterium]MBL8983891.1 PadR family transcriptional regulator [Gemmatimonadota bacterium]
MADDLELMQGTLDVLVLRALLWGERHGYAVARWIRESSRDALTIEDRALYVALHRLEARGAVSSSWGVSENNRRARYYALTATGRRLLRTETDRWSRYVAAVGAVLIANADGGAA